VLEAMSCGTPVVTSTGSGTEEVAGDAAVLVDPLDVDAIAAAIDAASRRRDELAALGLRRAQAYGWEQSAAAAAAGYAKAAA
jgi:glycosyltransferase involved in cell wall biosynthesis